MFITLTRMLVVQILWTLNADDNTHEKKYMIMYESVSASNRFTDHTIKTREYND